MGVKIDKAIYVKTNKEMSNIEADNQELNGEVFICPYCKIKLTFRRSGKRKLENKIINVSPYFRLEKDKEHDMKCKYNTLGQIDIIARKPLALKDFMEKTKMDQYALRLQVVKKAIMEPPEEAEEIMIDNPESISIASKKVFENKGSMSPYLSRMKDIMILRSKMEENNDVKKHLQLEYKNRVISWDKFYFGPEYKDFLTLSKYFRSKSKPDHPICIEGIVKEHSTETDRRGEKYYSFLFEKPYVTEVNIDGFRHIPSVRVNIYEKYKKLLHFVKENYQKHNKQIITYGNPYVNVNTYAPHNAKYHNITIWVNRTAQVHLFNETMEKLFEET